MGFGRYIPDEIKSSWSSACNMIENAKKTNSFACKLFLSYSIPVVVGILIGFLAHRYLPPSTLSHSIGKIAATLSTLASVFSGFIVTLMLFTGRGAGASSLAYEKACTYAQKIKYLLFSQLQTLVSYLVVMLVSFSELLLSPGITTSKFYIGTLSACVLIAATRTILIPFQIYEIHEFELDSIVEEKKKLLDDRLLKEK